MTLEKESIEKMRGRGDYSKYDHPYAENLENEVFHNPELFDRYKDVVYDLPEAVFKYRLSEAFIEHHADEISWDRVSVFQKLSEPFILKHADKLRMDYISFYQTLSGEFIERNQGILYWHGISAQKGLSWEFRLKYKDKINWDYVSRYVPLTEEEIRKYQDLLVFEELLPNQQVSDEFIEEFAHKIQDWEEFLYELYPETDKQIRFYEKNEWRAKNKWSAE